MNRNTVNFKEFKDACIQATALANFYSKGRFCVYKKAEKHFIVAYDECKERNGVDESDILFQAVSNCNSGTKSYSECRKNAELQSLYF